METRTSSVIKKIIVVIFLTVLADIAFAQEDNFLQTEKWRLCSVNYNIAYTGNGLSAYNEIGFTLGSSTQHLNFGIHTSPKPLKIIGGSVNYQYYLLPSEEETNIYFSVVSEIKINTTLTQTLNSLMHEKDFNGEFEKFNTYDVGIGFGFNEKLFWGISVNTVLHLDFYKRQLASSEDLRTPDYARYSEDSGSVLNLKVGLIYEF